MEDELKEQLDNLDINKRGGPDGIPNIFVKECKDSLITPLYKIFNRSLSEGKCPVFWKSSSLTPIFKSGDKSEIKNYRAVCKQSTFMKIFEKIIYAKVSFFMNELISDHQHGFQKNKSILSNLAEYSSYIAQSFEENAEVHSIYTDIARAFDTVDISILLKKMNHYGIRGTLLKWFESYLRGRRLHVNFNGCDSFQFEPGNGIPQGSTVGPFLFLLFINDLPAHIDSEILMFADDAKIFKKIRSVDDCGQLQNDIETFIRWCEINHLEINREKCQFVMNLPTISMIKISLKSTK